MPASTEPYVGEGQISLIIKGVYLDQIIAGTKTKETREIRHNTAWKYCNLDKEKNFVSMKHPATLELLVGYNADRRRAVVEVTGVLLDIEAYIDTDGKEKPLTYTHKGVEYAYCSVIFSLGKVVSAT